MFLQEVQGENKAKSALYYDWPDCSHFEHLADSVWDHYAYGKNAAYESGHHGNAILSKFPIENWQNFNVSTNKIEKRGVLYARLEVPGTELKIDCMSLHLNLFKSGRSRQISSIIKIIKEHAAVEHPFIIAGDFNDWSQNITEKMEKLNLTEAYKSIHGGYPRTFPSNFPLLTLDRIYFKGASVLSASVMKDWKHESDHLALLAEFQLG